MSEKISLDSSELEYNVRVLEHSIKRICYTFAAVYLEAVLIFYRQLILLFSCCFRLCFEYLLAISVPLLRQIACYLPH